MQTEIASREIKQYAEKLKEKQDELKKLNRKVKVHKLMTNNYTRNTDKALRCSKQMEKLTSVKADYDKRKLELEEEVKQRQEDKQKYIDDIEEIHNQVKQLRETFT